MARLANVHPGDVLLEDFLKPMGLSQNALARAIGVSPRRINEICLRKRAVTADTAIRLGRYFGTSKELWMGLQSGYDFEEAERKHSYARIKPMKRPENQGDARA